MRSVRLTQDMRQKILGRLLEHAFGARTRELQADDDVFGLAVYEDVYAPLMRSRMKSFPAGFFHLASHFMVAFGGQQDQVCWKGLLPIASKHEYDRVASYPADHALSQRHDALEKRRGDLRAERERARSQIKGVLFSCTTLRQLVEIWPEAASFVKDFEQSGPAVVTALALPIKSLNEQLGLPPAEVVPAPATVSTKKSGRTGKLRKLQLSSAYGKFGPSGGSDARG